jgi:hypothetical protein
VATSGTPCGTAVETWSSWAFVAVRIVVRMGLLGMIIAGLECVLRSGEI